MIWERNFNCDLNSLNHRGLPKQSQINIYTDGSKTPNHAGAGIAIIKHGNLRHTESIKLNPNVTIFQAEAKAILMRSLSSTERKMRTTYASSQTPRPRSSFYTILMSHQIS